jgi:hypothetical protein
VPRYRVINRRSTLDPLVRKTVVVSEAALDRINEIGARMEVSQGSLVDTALRLLATKPVDEIAELLRLYGHLSDDEYAYVTGVRPQKGEK